MELWRQKKPLSGGRHWIAWGPDGPRFHTGFIRKRGSKKKPAGHERPLSLTHAGARAMSKQKLGCFIEAYKKKSGEGDPKGPGSGAKAS